MLKDCYKNNTYILYNRNVGGIGVNLVPTMDPKCEIFPKGIRARLVLGSDEVADVLETTITNFDYKTYVQINFTAPEDKIIEGESYAVLDIFSLAEHTEVKIFKFVE